MNFLKANKIIIDRILSDNNFNIELAKELGIQQQSIIALARRDSSKLTLYKAILFYKKKGYKEKEIFDPLIND